MSLRVSRRAFAKVGAAAMLGAAAPQTPRASPGKPHEDWLSMREDPIRKMFAQGTDLDRILALFPRTQG